jgi:hypothetical protein
MQQSEFSKSGSFQPDFSWYHQSPMNVPDYASFSQSSRLQPYPVQPYFAQQPLPFRAVNAQDVMTDAFQKQCKMFERELEDRVGKIKLPEHCFRGSDADSARFSDFFAKSKNETESFVDAEDGDVTDEDAGAGDKASKVREDKNGKDTTDEGTAKLRARVTALEAQNTDLRQKAGQLRVDQEKLQRVIAEGVRLEKEHKLTIERLQKTLSAEQKALSEERKARKLDQEGLLAMTTRAGRFSKLADESASALEGIARTSLAMQDQLDDPAKCKAFVVHMLAFANKFKPVAEDEDQE